MSVRFTGIEEGVSSCLETLPIHTHAQTHSLDSEDKDILDVPGAQLLLRRDEYEAAYE